jgi:predicted anti-sigma-YlaC factor YlaD
MSARAGLLVGVVVLLAGAGCSVRRLAVNALADALAEAGDVYASDGDPQLVREALPFALKTYESLLAEAPRDRELLVATARGFTQYAYGFLVNDAERLEATDLEASLAVRRRVRRLLLRGRDYALRALEADHPGLGDELRAGGREGLAALGGKDVPALFWTGAAWGAAIAVLKTDPDLLADLPVAEAMLRRVIELEEGFARGGAHEVMITLEAGLVGGSLERAREHFARAVALTEGRSAAPYVTLAETVAVQEQDRALFDEMIGKALAVDPDGEPSLRLSNALAQERARWLQARADELFF